MMQSIGQAPGPWPSGRMVYHPSGMAAAPHVAPGMQLQMQMQRFSQPPQPGPMFQDTQGQVYAAVTIDLEVSEAEQAALETRISLLKRERRRLEAELTRELAAAGKTPPPTSIMQQPSLVEAASSASASDAGPHHGPGLFFDTHAGGTSQARPPGR